MFGSLGMPELIFILVLALLVFGPKRLPDVGRTLGKGLREFRRATSDLKRTVETEMSAVDVEETRTPTAVPIASASVARGGEPVPSAEPAEATEPAAADGATADEGAADEGAADEGTADAETLGEGAGEPTPSAGEAETVDSARAE